MTVLNQLFIVVSPSVRMALNLNHDHDHDLANPDFNCRSPFHSLTAIKARRVLALKHFALFRDL